MDRKLVITHDIFIADWRADGACMNQVANYKITEIQVY